MFSEILLYETALLLINEPHTGVGSGMQRQTGRKVLQVEIGRGRQVGAGRA